MDKTAIRYFAIEARKILMKSAITEAGFYGITKDGCAAPVQKGSDFEVYQTLAGTENRIYGDDIKRRANLVKAIQEQGFEQVIEETAYTWFNRIIAIRFMEVNNYLPTRVRVLSSETGSGTPDIISQADTVELNLTASELDRIQTAKRENKYDEAFRLLFVKQCNELNEILPGLFEKTNDYMELLLKITYTGDGVVRMLVDSIPEDNFNVETEGQVEIIGWMYQYYNTELKDDTFAKLKKNVKISKERIPAATQLFTPDWIVRYMVENALGRVWIEHLHAVDPSIDEKAKAAEFGWKYYLPEAEQEADVAAQLVEIRKSYRELTPQDITCIDPCMGSGHILVYMFDVLMDIYRSEGFSEREAVFDILEKNIRGLDIDRRAYQLSYFALMMKARGYNRIFFRGKENVEGERVLAEPQVFAIEESNSVNRAQLKYFGDGLSELEKNDAINQINGILDQLIDAREYGSILYIETYNWELMRRYIAKYSIPGQMDLGMIGIQDTQNQIIKIINIAAMLADKYDAVITNPPYMNMSSGDAKLNEYVKKHYKDTKTDLFACFLEKGNSMIRESGFNSMVTMQSWMFLSSFEKMRISMLKKHSITNLMHMENMVMGIAFGTAVTITYGRNVKKYRGTYNQIKLCDIKNENPFEFPVQANRFNQIGAEEFEKIPGSPIAYWVCREALEAFEKCPALGSICNVKNGMSTTNNNRFLRQWYEVSFDKVGLGVSDAVEAKATGKKWFPYNKGGDFRKWYGNTSLVVNWEGDGKEIKKAAEGASGGRIVSQEFYFMPSASWSKVTSGQFVLRYFPKGFLFDVAGPSIFSDDKLQKYIMGILNSKLKKIFLEEIYPTINFEMGQISSFPIKKDESLYNEIVRLVEENILLEKEDWDSFETSWDFKRHPLLPKILGSSSVEEEFNRWKTITGERFERVKTNEEKINQMVIDLYGLNNQLNSSMDNSDITMYKAEVEKDIKSFLSYFIGCMFGRYSLSVDGVGSFFESGSVNFEIDKDNIIPITDEAYFDDDIIKRLKEFLVIVYGEQNLESNMKFIAKALSKDEVEPEKIIRSYFLNGFYDDHISHYFASNLGKKPIYWMFDAGKENGFKCLMYIHRYTPDTVGLIRSDYLVKAQGAIENSLKNVEFAISSAISTVDKARATKDRDRFIKQLAEIKMYYPALSHVALQRIEMNLDNGVKENYQLFQGVEVSNEGEKKQTIDLLAKI